MQPLHYASSKFERAFKNKPLPEKQELSDCGQRNAGMAGYLLATVRVQLWKVGMGGRAGGGRVLSLMGIKAMEHVYYIRVF